MQRYQLNKGGKERPVVLERAHAFIDRLPDSKSWVIEIREFRKQRTDDQNAALFGLAYPAICAATGYDPNDLHEACCGKFFGWIEVEVMGEIKRRPFRSTTKNENGDRDVLPTIRFAEFYNMVQRVAADIGIDVPDPDPFYKEARAA